MKTIFLMLWALSFNAFAEQAQQKVYEDTFLKLVYPESFVVSSETDADGIVSLYIDGPGTTSVFINITPEPYDFDLQEVADVMHELLMSEMDMGDALKRKVLKTQMQISNAIYPGIINFYSARNKQDRSTFQYTLYLVNATSHTFLIQEERRNEYIEKHNDIVTKIINSIELK